MGLGRLVEYLLFVILFVVLGYVMALTKYDVIATLGIMFLFVWSYKTLVARRNYHG